MGYTVVCTGGVRESRGRRSRLWQRRARDVKRPQSKCYNAKTSEVKQTNRSHRYVSPGEVHVDVLLLRSLGLFRNAFVSERKAHLCVFFT